MEKQGKGIKWLTVNIIELARNILAYGLQMKKVRQEVINCRCVALTRARWGLDEDELNS